MQRLVDFKKLSLCQRADFKFEYQKSIEDRQRIIEELHQCFIQGFSSRRAKKFSGGGG
jgi:hypothetical protein